jgi:Spy/CpxP family protein refolding chaperone
MKKSTIISVLFIATLMWAFSAEAQGWGRGGGGRGAGPGWQDDTFGLNLTQEQTTKLNTMRQAFWKDTSSLNVKFDQKQLELNSLLLEPNPDSGKVVKLQKEISELQTQFSDKRINYQLESRKILTAEQIAQLPPGCTLGFGNLMGGPGPGYGCGMGPGYGGGRGMGYGCGRGAGFGRGCGWW